MYTEGGVERAEESELQSTRCRWCRRLRCKRCCRRWCCSKRCRKKCGKQVRQKCAAKRCGKEVRKEVRQTSAAKRCDKEVRQRVQDITHCHTPPHIITAAQTQPTNTTLTHCKGHHNNTLQGTRHQHTARDTHINTQHQHTTDSHNKPRHSETERTRHSTAT